MHLHGLDWALIALFPIVSLAIGIAVSRRAGRSSETYFLSGRNMPWWLLGASMVATTFSADTPNLVTDIVRTGGVAKNWIWWSFLPTGMVTAFVYAKLWRRSGVLTDLEFYTIRYSSDVARYLRGFRAIYIGIVFNVLIMASVSLAAIKIGAVVVGASPLEVLVTLGLVTMAFTAAGGFLGVVVSDLILFCAAMTGAIGAAIYLVRLPQVGGLAALMTNSRIVPQLDMLPDFTNREVALAVFVIPLTIQWWSVWYPGSEPGGGGFVAQRMLAARNSRHAAGAVLLFQFAHYALRPWPWILVALASLIVFPDLAAIRHAFPGVPAGSIGHDLAYPAMLTLLPSGLIGLVVASLAAAYMSSMATQLNWGASYIVNDLWARFVDPDASQRALVRVGRVSTILLMVCAGLLALCLSNALQAFQILLSVGAGTGLLFLLRWYWWRISAYSEFAAMVTSVLVAVAMSLWAPAAWDSGVRLMVSVTLTTVGWVLVTLLTPPTDRATLYAFVRLVDPAGPGWRRVRRWAAADAVDLPPNERGSLAMGIACVPIATAGIYGALFATGALLRDDPARALLLGLLPVGATIFLARHWNSLFAAEDDQDVISREELRYGH